MVVIKIVYKTTLTNSYYEKTLAIGEVKCIDDEIPFDIPRGWQWCRFGSLSFNRDSERIPLSASERNGLDKLYDYYGASGVIDKVDKYLFDKPLLLIGEDGANLINRSTPIAFIATGRYWVNNHAHVIDFISDSLMKYMCNYINAISLIDYVTGTAQPKMNQEKMNSILVAVPPMHEQIRINEQLTKILPIIAKYSRQQNVLDNFNRIISENIRKSILQEAIQGRLVPQIESEGTAEELIEEIRAEKLRLVKEGKLKKSALANESRIFRGEDNRYYVKTGSETDCIDEILLDIPSTWEWVTLGELIVDSTGLSYKKENLADKSGPFIRVLRGGNIEDGIMRFRDDDVFISAKYVPHNLLLTKGTYISPAVSSLEKIGKTAIVDRNYTDTVVGGFVLILTPTFCDTELGKYLYYFFQSAFYQNYCRKITKKSGQAFYNLSRKKLVLCPVPIPPKAELKRILYTLEKVLAGIMSR